MARKVKRAGVPQAELMRLLDAQAAAAERTKAEAAAKAAEEARLAEIEARRVAHAARQEADRVAAEQRRADRAKRPRFVRQQTEQQQRPAAPAAVAPLRRGTTFTAKLLTKNLALPPKEDQAQRKL